MKLLFLTVLIFFLNKCAPPDNESMQQTLKQVWMKYDCFAHQRTQTAAVAPLCCDSRLNCC